ncbi:MAG: peptidoglycan DD-metalloendopeptidase family protein [Candidatus Kaiserbacteria bacterium]|nr:peptidoglycan DD-metalloendopeptidase family protein [Candidatus Kaiserbacteria bacterium]
MMRAGFLFFLFLFSVGFVLSTPSLAHADTASDIQSRIDANNKQLDSLKAEIATFQKQLDDIGAKKNTLQSTIDSLTLSQKQLAIQIQATQNKIASANLQIQQLTFSIGDKETSIATNQDAIAKALRRVAEEEQTPLIVKLLSAHSLNDAWQATDEAAQFNRALSNDIKNLRTARTALATNRDKVTAAKAELVSLQSELSLQKKSIDLQKAAQQKLLADTKNQESSYQKIIASKKAEESSFNATLDALQSQLKYVLDPKTIPIAGKGVLRWPLTNVYITQEFGKTSSSGRLYVSGTHNGIDFRASIGTPVKASLSGTVLEINYGAVQNCQYGKWILIKHLNGLATLYAHLSDISVQKGATVLTGQIIGFSGNTGYATGPHLHLGVYIAEAISFKQYTCLNKSVVTIPIAPTNAYLDPLSYL